MPLHLPGHRRFQPQWLPKSLEKRQGKHENSQSPHGCLWDEEIEAESRSQSRAFPGEPQTPNKLVPERIPVLIPEQQHPEVPALGIRQGWSSWKGIWGHHFGRWDTHSRSTQNFPEEHSQPPQRSYPTGALLQKEQGKAGLIPARRRVPWEHTIPFKSALSLLLPTPRPHPGIFLIPIS